jgi:putative transposase
MAVRIGGKRHWLWRAVDEHGTTLDVLLQERRNTDAAERFFRRLLGRADKEPERITADKLGSYAAALRRMRAGHPRRARAAGPQRCPTTMIYTHVLNRGRRGARSPLGVD